MVNRLEGGGAEIAVQINNIERTYWGSVGFFKGIKR